FYSQFIGFSVFSAGLLFFTSAFRCYTFLLTFATFQFYKKHTAARTEQVYIIIGASGTAMPLLTRLGNIFYSDRLILCRDYRIAYGNNGLPAGIPHFINFNTPKCTAAYNPAGIPTP
ncbi:MAG: hypothetical protein FWC92_07085, partial [Defluviitaleaceae bacterium]|nr:hypothetical protein [Defluviitaleaceae bacterium]